MGWLKKTCAFILVLLTFFELPGWCLNASVNDGKDGCKTDSNMYPNFGLPMLPPSLAALINVPCLLIASFDIYLQAKIFGWHSIWMLRRHRIEIILVGVSVWDITLGVEYFVV